MLQKTHLLPERSGENRGHDALNQNREDEEDAEESHACNLVQEQPTPLPLTGLSIDRTMLYDVSRRRSGRDAHYKRCRRIPRFPNEFQNCNVRFPVVLDEFHEFQILLLKRLINDIFYILETGIRGIRQFLKGNTSWNRGIRRETVGIRQEVDPNAHGRENRDVMNSILLKTRHGRIPHQRSDPKKDIENTMDCNPDAAIKLYER